MSGKIVERAHKLVHNKVYFDTYERYLQEKRTMGTAKAYRSEIIRFLEFFENKEYSIENVILDGIKSYAEAYPIDQGAHSAIKDFFTVISGTKKVNFTVEELTRLLDEKKKGHSST